MNLTLQENKVESLAQLKAALQEIKIGEISPNSNSIHSTLNVQMHIINMVSSSTLVDSSFDLIFAELKKALRHTENEDERENIRERISLYINSYIFFLDAKLRYSFKKDEEDTEALIEQASMLLAENSAEVLLLASGGKAPKIIISKIASEILKKAKDKPGLIKKIWRWYNSEQRQKDDTVNFHNTLDFLFKKLERHKDSIGKSDIIAGLVSRWSPEVIACRTKDVKITVLGFSLAFFFTSAICLFLYMYLKEGPLEDILLEYQIIKILSLGFVVTLLITSHIFSTFLNNFKVKKKIENLENYFYN